MLQAADLLLRRAHLVLHTRHHVLRTGNQLLPDDSQLCTCELLSDRHVRHQRVLPDDGVLCTRRLSDELLCHVSRRDMQRQQLLSDRFQRRAECFRPAGEHAGSTRRCSSAAATVHAVRKYLRCRHEPVAASAQSANGQPSADCPRSRPQHWMGTDSLSFRPLNRNLNNERLSVSHRQPFVV
jgi:hypothetical protein